MTLGGWITMILSVGSVTLLCIWTMSRVLRGRKNRESLAHVEPLDEEEAERR